jgi:hypothetical protein
MVVLGLGREAVQAWDARQIPWKSGNFGGLCSDRVWLEHELEVDDAANTRTQGIGDSKRGTGLTVRQSEGEGQGASVWLLGRPKSGTREWAYGLGQWMRKQAKACCGLRATGRGKRSRPDE